MPSQRDALVPGTVHLVDLSGHRSGQHDRNNKDIVLVPQPNESPEDPLNWSRTRKFFALAMVFVYTLGVGIPTTLHYSVIADITRDTGISTAQLVQGNGIMFLFLGWGCLFWQPIAMAYGRRGVYLISTLCTVPIMVWTAHSSSAGEWYAHRVIIGLVCAPIEALPEISIADLFFAHDRGTWMSTYVLVLFESNFIAPLIAGWFNDAFGWRRTMYFGAGIAAGAFLILLLSMEETMYFRQIVEGLEEQSDDEVSRTPGSDTLGIVEKEGLSGHAAPAKNDMSVTGLPDRRAHVDCIANEGIPGGHPAATTTVDLRSFWRKLMPFRLDSERPSATQVLWMMWRPLPIIVRFPNIAFAGFIYGINLSWYNVLNGTASPVLSASPYNWSAALVGCIYIGPMIGAVGGCLWGGIVADRFAIYLARRNGKVQWSRPVSHGADHKTGGIREPEHRLWPLSIAGLFTTAGLITWGVGADHGIHWVGLAFGLGMLTFGLIVGGGVALSYAVDCFKETSGESMASIIIIRNTIGFGFSYAITPWYTNMGLTGCFLLAGFVSLACMATFLLMIWKGKTLRRRSTDVYWRYVASNISGH